MAGSKILVLGATGPAGLLLLRELLHRQHETIAYVRSASKIPEDLASKPLLQVIRGQMNELDKLETAVAGSKAIISLLGPTQSSVVEKTTYSSIYSALFPLMRKHGVKRILAMGTLSITDPSDSPSFIRFLLVILIRVIASAAYNAIIDVGRIFQEEADGLDWTLFRIGFISGESDEASWKAGREDGPTYAGYIAKPGWTSSLKRASLARWLVDEVESDKWVGKLPAVSKSSIQEKKGV